MGHDLSLNLVYYTLAMAVFTITPGPDMLLVIRSSFQDGSRTGLGATMGIAVSSCVWALLFALGMTLLLAASKAGIVILGWAGAFYLAWLGLRLILWPGDGLKALAETSTLENDAAVARTPNEAGMVLPAPAVPGFWRGFRQGWLADMLSPETGMFLLTFYPQFIPKNGSIGFYTLILTLLQIAVLFVCFIPMVFAAQTFGRIFASPRAAHWMDRVAGVIFILFALKVVASGIGGSAG